MLKILSFTDDIIIPKIEIDYYIPFRIKFTDDPFSKYLRYVNEELLLEIGFDYKGQITKIFLVSIPSEKISITRKNFESKDKRINKGIPICDLDYWKDLPIREDVGSSFNESFRDKNILEYQLYVGLDYCELFLCNNRNELLYYKSDSVIFGINNEDELCYICVMNLDRKLTKIIESF